MTQHVQLELPNLTRPGKLRAPKTAGTARTATAAMAQPSSAGRRQLGRRACYLVAELLQCRALMNPDLLMHETADVLDRYPLSQPDNAAHLKVATAAAWYMRSTTMPPSVHWLGYQLREEGMTSSDIPPLLLFETLDNLIYIDAMVLGSSRHPRSELIEAGRDALAWVKKQTGHEADGARVFLPARPQESLWVPAGSPRDAVPVFSEQMLKEGLSRVA